MRVTELKDFAHPDEVRTFEKGRAEILNTTGGVVGRMVLEPGWRWSKHVKPIAKTELCQAPHFQYHVSGTLHVVMAGGTEFDAGPGAITSLQAGHDGWVVGKEPVVLVDFFGATEYAKH